MGILTQASLQSEKVADKQQNDPIRVPLTGYSYGTIKNKLSANTNRLFIKWTLGNLITLIRKHKRFIEREERSYKNLRGDQKKHRYKKNPYLNTEL